MKKWSFILPCREPRSQRLRKLSCLAKLH